MELMGDLAEGHAGISDAQPAGPPVPAPALEVPLVSAANNHIERLQFTGLAGEYWRLWALNLVLNVFSLGLYSPWAKLHKMRWFARRTFLLGDSFDYQARPWRMLIGRLLALALLLAYGHAFDFSLVAGLLLYMGLLVIGPLMFASGQRFRLRASRWRGLAFDFKVSARRCYGVCLPFLLAWLVPVGLVQQSSKPDQWWFLVLLPWLLLPWAHARLKALQHQNSEFLGRRFEFDSVTGAFYGNYLLGILFLMLAGTVVALVSMGLGKLFAGGVPGRWAVMAYGIATMLLVYMLSWPMFAARQQKSVWERTRWGQVQFHCDIGAWQAMALVLKHGPLVLLSLGLWWPVAAVAWARLRVQAISLEADQSLEDLLAQMQSTAAPESSHLAASADAAVDLYDLDLGW